MAIKSIMNTIEQMESALISAEEFLKILVVYHRDGVLLPDAPDYVTKEFLNALVVAGSNCTEAINSYRAHKN
jgi:hypothetical protein